MAYPNPLNPETTLEFRTSQDGPVKVQVFDIAGRLVRTLQDGNLPAGYNSVRWNGTTSTGNKVSSGVYYFKISAVGGDTVVRVTVLK
jgi:flagellar hook assembly protein FlgD